MFVKKLTTQIPAAFSQAAEWNKFIVEWGIMWDRSLRATLLTLLHNRISENENVAVIFERNANANKMSAAQVAESRMPSWKIEDTDSAFYIGRTTYDLSEEKVKEIGAIMSLDGYKIRTDIRQYCLERGVNGAFFVNEAKHSTIVYVENLMGKAFHLIQAFIPALMPWFFNSEEKKLSDKEKELLISLTNHSADKYIEKLMQCIDLDAIMADERLRTIRNFFVSTQQATISHAKETAESLLGRMASLMDEYNEQLQAYRDAEIRLAGLQGQQEQGIEEFINYIKSVRNVELHGRNGQLEVETMGYLSNFDVDLYETLIANPRSYLYPGNDGNNPSLVGWTHDATKRLLDAIFGPNPKLKVRTTGYYKVNIEDFRVFATPGTRALSFPNTIENPHLFFYGCLGDHMRFLCEAAEKADWIGFVNQCFSSTASLNIGESVTVTKFIHKLLTTSNKILEDDQHNLYNASEAEAWLKNNEGQTASAE